MINRKIAIFPKKELIEPTVKDKAKPVGLRSWSEAKKHFEGVQSSKTEKKASKEENQEEKKTSENYTVCN